MNKPFTATKIMLTYLLYFCRGFHDVIPFDAITQFDEGGLELLLGGIGTINVKDWRDNTVYKSYQPSDTVCYIVYSTV